MAEITIVIRDGESLTDVLNQLSTSSLSSTVVSGDAPMVSDLAKQTIKDITSEPPAPETTPPAEDQIPDDVSQWIGEGEQQQQDTGGVEVDADGVPWDERIHSGNHKKGEKSGKWMKRKGVDPTLYTQVTAELQQLMQNSTPAPAAPPAAPATPPAPAAPPAAPATPPAPAAPPAAPATSAVWDWPTLLMATTNAYGNKQFTVEARDTALAELGIADFALLSTRPDLFAEFAMKLGLAFPE